jgi:hypothetical protein
MDSPSESESTRRTHRLGRDCPAEGEKKGKLYFILVLGNFYFFTFYFHF